MYYCPKGMLDTANCFGRPDSVRIVCVSVSIKRLQLSSLFPSQCVPEVGCRVALCIVGNGLVTVLCKQVFPSAVNIHICDTFVNKIQTMLNDIKHNSYKNASVMLWLSISLLFYFYFHHDRIYFFVISRCKTFI